MMRARVTHTVPAYAALFSQTDLGPPPLASGEAAMTNFLPRACARIHHYVPQAKLIAILRNPIDRAYSQFINARRMGWEPLADFGAALAAEAERMRQGWIPYLCYTYRGYYAARLAPYFAAFPADQIRIYRYESWQETPQLLLADLFAFLGVDPSFAPTVPRVNAGYLPRYPWLARWLRRSTWLTARLRQLLAVTQRGGATPHPEQHRRPPPLPTLLRQQLIATYQEDISNLQRLLVQDFSDWLAPV